MARLYKCYGTCGEKYEKENMFVHSNKNYCKPCYEQTVRNNDDRITLYNLIKLHYKVQFPTSMHMAQIKKVHENYSYNDMIFGIRYVAEVLRTRLQPNMGFGYVSNNIEAAKMHYKKQAQQQITNDDAFAFGTFAEDKVKVMKMDNTNLLRKSKMINLEDII